MKFNSWYLSSLLISLIVLIPIITVFTSFFENTSNYYEILKNTFLMEYIFNSFILLLFVLLLTFLIGTGTAYLVSFPLSSSLIRWGTSFIGIWIEPFIFEKTTSLLNSKIIVSKQDNKNTFLSLAALKNYSND